ncbi:putative uncharacterized protein [Clostridium sp. CAG:505]|nr:putative uncharacterized protein [Clostridium sp. CAG:505]
MDDIKEIKDLFQFILQADDIGHDSSFGSDIIIPVYDISPEEFLAFAENAISSGTKEGLVNATSNLKRALDCEMDMFFECINLKRIIDKNNLKFARKTQFLADIGLFPIESINKLNLMRNKLEHEYKIPEISDLLVYYELVWSIVKILDLHLELLYINGEINLELYIKSNIYYFTVQHDVKECSFKFEVRDRTKGNENLTKQLNGSIPKFV